MIDRLGYYGRYAWDTLVLRRCPPLVFGVGITDRCNLACAGCRVANTGLGDLSWERLEAMMVDASERGFRDLYFTGGEPMLWRDGERGIDAAVRLAHDLGFFHVHVYTNGTLGLDCGADLVWTSIDGLPDAYKTRRGDHFDEVERAVRAKGHPPVAVIYVVDRRTVEGIEPFLRWVRDSRLPVLGVMFYFHTPYYGFDELYLNAEERAPIVDRLLQGVREGLPILNSRAGLLAFKSGVWPRRLPMAVVADASGESVCCRAPDAACPDCGYTACVEMAEARRLRPSAVLAMARYW
ncbi:MAG TPA: radical SAM protein [Coriobacteriia bacterium]